MGIELVVGLGNPEDRYGETRHNVGFRVVDELARRHAAAGWVRFPWYRITPAWFGPRLLLAKPSTFMNRSGDAVARLLDHLDIKPIQMLVVLDDVDIPLGWLRMRPSGGPGTHNGLRDICDRIGRDFPRLRFGIHGDGDWEDLADFVLSPFAESETAFVAGMIERAADAAETAISHGIGLAMSRYNGPPPDGVEVLPPNRSRPEF